VSREYVHFRTPHSAGAHAITLQIPEVRAYVPLNLGDAGIAMTGPPDALLLVMNTSAITDTHAANDSTARVLVADDQTHVLDALQLLLKNQGYRTEAVTDPARVLPAVESSQFDLVLMDMNYERDTTAGAEGLQLVSQIRAKDNSLPLIVMTAWSSVELAVEAMRRGASDFVQKPWNNEQLLHKLQTQVERARALRATQRRSDDELREAREIQNNLLPSKLPQVNDYEVAGITQPVRFVGGDYYNVVRISERETVLCIADVAGKGLPAALLMSSLQAALNPLMWQKLAPRELCRRLNRILCDITPANKFISFFYGVLDSKEHRLTYCNAGHNPPILVSGQGPATELNAAGAVLGQFPDWVYEQSEAQLKRDDSLLMFTDGLVEACDNDDEPFGEWNLIRIAQENPSRSASELRDEMMKQASQHCGGHFQDDASLVVLRAL
jgi:phosphoserine phosphatase RsbU/P